MSRERPSGLTPPMLAVVAAAACALSAVAGQLALRPEPVAGGPADLPPSTLVRALARWDAGWYASIAEGGYWVRPGEQSPVAYFPAYPLAIRALTWLGLNRWVAGVGLSLACGLLALWLFGRWAARVAKDGAGTLATWLLTLYPFAFYLYGVMYSDALFLACAVAAFLALEKGHPVAAGLLGALAAVARPVAPALVLGLVVRSLELRRAQGAPVRARDFAPALAGLGLVAWMGYLQAQFGDALAFAHVHGAPGWDQAAGWRTWLKVAWFETLFPRVDPLVAVRLVGHAVTTLVALALSVLAVRRLGWGYGLYCLAAVGLPALSSKDFQGLGRYVMAAFPIFLVAASLLQRRTRLRLGWLAASAALLVALAFGFGAGGYVS